MKTKKQLLTLLAILAIPISAYAAIIDLGQINLTGTFTNHYASATSFGTLGPLTTQSATGIFAPYVSAGDTLEIGTGLLVLSSPPTWTIDGFTITSDYFTSIGIDTVYGQVTLSGNGFDPNAYPFGAYSAWYFDFPPFAGGELRGDVTAPISMTIDVAYDNHLPETGSTCALLLLALSAVLFTHRLVEHRRV